MTTLAVSKVQLDLAGRITAVLWGREDWVRNAWATPEVVVPVSVAVDAINAGSRVSARFPSLHGHLADRRFVVADDDGGRQTIALEGPATREREVHDMDRLEGPAPQAATRRALPASPGRIGHP